MGFQLTAANISTKIHIRSNNWAANEPADEIENGELKEACESLLVREIAV